MANQNLKLSLIHVSEVCQRLAKRVDDPDFNHYDAEAGLNEIRDQLSKVASEYQHSMACGGVTAP